jgi:hypothetical protein
VPHLQQRPFSQEATERNSGHNDASNLLFIEICFFTHFLLTLHHSIATVAALRLDRPKTHH